MGTYVVPERARSWLKVTWVLMADLGLEPRAHGSLP